MEWYAGETEESSAYRKSRQNIGFKYNLFEHIGATSTLRSMKSGAFPMCYDLLVEPVLFKVEAWSSKECPKDDIWPCGVVSRQRFLDLTSIIKSTH